MAHPSGGAGGESASLPASSLHLRAHDEFPGFPEFCIVRLYRRQVSELPRILGPSVQSVDGSSSFLESRILQAALVANPRVSPLFRSTCAPMMSFRVSPNSASSGCTDGKFPSYLES
jgi:hypothetical protein